MREGKDRQQNAAKWLVVRPRAGLNDALCQIEKSWRFAEKNSRTLVLDTHSADIGVDFFDIFEIISKNEEPRVVGMNSATKECLNSKTTFPPELYGRVTTYQSFRDTKGIYRDRESEAKLKFGFRKDVNAEVIVHESEGGGVESEYLLNRVRLLPEICEKILKSLNELPDDWVSVHIRYSDLTTDYRTILGKVAALHKNDRVFVSSDSPEVHSYAQQLFGQRLISSPIIPLLTKNKPLHLLQLDPETRKQRFVNTLIDLFLLSCARQFYFATVQQRTGVSGFSRLAAFLAKSPEVRESLLSGYPNSRRFGATSAILLAPFCSRFLEEIRWSRKRLFRSLSTVIK